MHAAGSSPALRPRDPNHMGCPEKPTTGRGTPRPTTRHIGYSPRATSQPRGTSQPRAALDVSKASAAKPAPVVRPARSRPRPKGGPWVPIDDNVQPLDEAHAHALRQYMRLEHFPAIPRVFEAWAFASPADIARAAVYTCGRLEGDDPHSIATWAPARVVTVLFRQLYVVACTGTYPRPALVAAAAAIGALYYATRTSDPELRRAQAAVVRAHADAAAAAAETAEEERRAGGEAPLPTSYEVVTDGAAIVYRGATNAHADADWTTLPVKQHPFRPTPPWVTSDEGLEMRLLWRLQFGHVAAVPLQGPHLADPPPLTAATVASYAAAFEEACGVPWGPGLILATPAAVAACVPRAAALLDLRGRPFRDCRPLHCPYSAALWWATTLSRTLYLLAAMNLFPRASVQAAAAAVRSLLTAALAVPSASSQGLAAELSDAAEECRAVGGAGRSGDAVLRLVAAGRTGAVVGRPGADGQLEVALHRGFVLCAWRCEVGRQELDRARFLATDDPYDDAAAVYRNGAPLPGRAPVEAEAASVAAALRQLHETDRGMTEADEAEERAAIVRRAQRSAALVDLTEEEAAARWSLADAADRAVRAARRDLGAVVARASQQASRCAELDAAERSHRAAVADAEVRGRAELSVRQRKSADACALRARRAASVSAQLEQWSALEANKRHALTWELAAAASELEATGEGLAATARLQATARARAEASEATARAVLEGTWVAAQDDLALRFADERVAVRCTWPDPSPSPAPVRDRRSSLWGAPSPLTPPSTSMTPPVEKALFPQGSPPALQAQRSSLWHGSDAALNEALGSLAASVDGDAYSDPGADTDFAFDWRPRPSDPPAAQSPAASPTVRTSLPWQQSAHPDLGAEDSLIPSLSPSPAAGRYPALPRLSAASPLPQDQYGLPFPYQEDSYADDTAGDGELVLLLLHEAADDEQRARDQIEDAATAAATDLRAAHQVGLALAIDSSEAEARSVVRSGEAAAWTTLQQRAAAQRRAAELACLLQAVTSEEAMARPSVAGAEHAARRTITSAAASAAALSGATVAEAAHRREITREARRGLARLAVLSAALRDAADTAAVERRERGLIASTSRFVMAEAEARCRLAATASQEWCSIAATAAHGQESVARAIIAQEATSAGGPLQRAHAETVEALQRSVLMADATDVWVGLGARAAGLRQQAADECALLPPEADAELRASFNGAVAGLLGRDPHPDRVLGHPALIAAAAANACAVLEGPASPSPETCAAALWWAGALGRHLHVTARCEGLLPPCAVLAAARAVRALRTAAESEGRCPLSPEDLQQLTVEAALPPGTDVPRSYIARVTHPTGVVLRPPGIPRSVVAVLEVPLGHGDDARRLAAVEGAAAAALPAEPVQAEPMELTEEPLSGVVEEQAAVEVLGDAEVEADVDKTVVGAMASYDLSPPPELSPEPRPTVAYAAPSGPSMKDPKEPSLGTVRCDPCHLSPRGCSIASLGSVGCGSFLMTPYPDPTPRPSRALESYAVPGQESLLRSPASTAYSASPAPVSLSMVTAASAARPSAAPVRAAECPVCLFSDSDPAVVRAHIDEHHLPSGATNQRVLRWAVVAGMKLCRGCHATMLPSGQCCPCGGKASRPVSRLATPRTSPVRRAPSQAKSLGAPAPRVVLQTPPGCPPGECRAAMAELLPGLDVARLPLCPGRLVSWAAAVSRGLRPGTCHSRGVVAHAARVLLGVAHALFPLLPLRAAAGAALEAAQRVADLADAPAAPCHLLAGPADDDLGAFAAAAAAAGPVDRGTEAVWVDVYYGRLWTAPALAGPWTPHSLHAAFPYVSRDPAAPPPA